MCNKSCLWNTSICDALRYLVPFVQFKKRKKHPWRSVNFSKVVGTYLLLVYDKISEIDEYSNNCCKSILSK